MKSNRLTCLVCAMALFLSACGGGDDAPQKPTFTAVVSFGDSLSDVGTYAPATSLTGNGAAPYFGGKFTTNGADAKIWVELIAASLGIALTAAEVGFDQQSVKCPAAASDAAAARTCTAYGQGGARVTGTVGIGNNGDGTGALTVPVVQQIANHLQRFGAFNKTDLVFVYAGNNDVFIDFALYGFIAEILDGQVASGAITPAEAAAQLAAAQTAAEFDVAAAATELANDVKTMIVAKGATHVAVMTLNDIADTPFGNSVPASLRAELTRLSVVFNTALTAGLDGVPVRIIDTLPLSKEVYANPAKYGFVNNTTPACDPTRIAVLTGGAVDDGSSLFCNGTAGAPYYGLGAGADVLSWQFADQVHPTTGGHRAIAAAFTAKLKAFGWI